jgi:hypothetical protein
VFVVVVGRRLPHRPLRRTIGPAIGMHRGQIIFHKGWNNYRNLQTLTHLETRVDVQRNCAS